MVLLPAPFGPMMPSVSPAPTSNETSAAPRSLQCGAKPSLWSVRRSERRPASASIVC